MYKQDKKSSIIILISSISLIALSLNQIFDFFDTINSIIKLLFRFVFAKVGVPESNMNFTFKN